MKRRTFSTLAATACLLPDGLRAAEGKPLRVAVIGHTGRGNYGHGLDTVWLQLPTASTIVAVADADRDGLQQAKVRLGRVPGFDDYREMLARTDPDVVAVCPRHADQHHAMILAAIENGARGVYCEKPLCRNLEEVDALLAASKQHGVKIAVGHRNRYHPTLKVIDALIAAGELGRILELRGRGKGDRRGGCEDMWVLGSHVFNMFQYFAGPPLRCTAVLKRDGRAVTPTDVVEGNEGLGPMAGNEVHARFDHPNGLTSYFDSLADEETDGQAFGLQIVGSRGVVDIKLDRDPLAYLLPGNPWAAKTGGSSWLSITSAGVNKPETDPRIPRLIERHDISALDLINAIHADRAPLCDVSEAAMTIEMIHGVFASHTRAGQSVEIPLNHRSHPLKSWTA